ncbi:MAG: MFS transporter [Thermoplasmata archaeon]
MRDRVYYGWIVVLAAFLAILVSSLRSYAFGVFIEPLSEDFGWARAPISLTYSISLLLTSLFAIIFGRLSDRYGVRKAMMLGAALVVPGYLFSSRIDSLYQLYLAFAVIGIGSGAFYVPVTTTVTRWFDENKGLAVGITVSALGIGMAFFPPALERMIQSAGWRTTFVAMAFISLLLVLISAYLIRDSPESVGLEKKEQETREDHTDLELNLTLFQAFKTKRFWIIYVMFLVAQFSALLVTVHIVPYSEGIGFPSFYAAMTLTAVGLANIFGRLLGGWTSDKIGVVKGTMIFFFVQSLTLFLFPAAEIIPLLYAVSLIFGLAFGGWVMIYPVIVSEFFGSKHSGEILGALGTVAGMGGALGPYFAGYIYDVTGKYDIAFFVGGLMTILSLVLSIILYFSEKKRSIE